MLLAASFIFVLFLSIFVRNARKPILCLLLGAAVGLGASAATRMRLEKVQSRYAENALRVTACVERVSDSYWPGRVRAVLRVEQADGDTAEFRCVCPAVPECAAGDRVECSLILECPDSTERLDLYADGIALAAKEVWGFSVVGQAEGFFPWASRMRARLSKALRTFLDEETGGVLAAMVLGDRRALPAELARDYRAAGLAHVLVVSGMHVSILCGEALYLPGRRKERSYASRRCKALFRAGAALLLVGVTGCTPSVRRAAAAVWISSVGVWVYGPPDALTSLAAAGFWMTLRNSYAVCDVGFELSFASVLGTLAAGELLCRAEEIRGKKREKQPFSRPAPWRRMFQGLMRELCSSLCVAACASAAAFPVLILRGMSVSLYSLLSGAAVLWMVKPMLLLGVGAALAGLVPAAVPLHKALSFCAGFLAWTLNGWVKMISAWPGAQLRFDTAYGALVCLLGWGLCLLAYRWHVRLRIAAPAILLVFAAALGLGSGLSRDVVRVELVGSINAPAVVITQDRQMMVLFRGGETTQSVVEALLEQRDIWEAALVVDLRMKRQTPCTLKTQQMIAAEEMRPNTSRILTRGEVQIEILRTRYGCLVRLQTGGRSLVTLSGTVQLAKTVRADWLLASPSRPDAIRWENALSLSEGYRWMEEGEAVKGQILLVRPGGGERAR
ncbi:MAG: ComEC/Rec2 family competence protein [Faecalibacterium sp.]